MNNLLIGFGLEGNKTVVFVKACGEDFF